MNFVFSTGAERVAVLEKLRQNEDGFPPTWEAHRHRQRKSMSMLLLMSRVKSDDFSVISSLLLHDVNARPSALELSQSSSLPPRVEDESLQSALRVLCELP
jgi:translation initiation factor 2-alpha kinase 4